MSDPINHPAHYNQGDVEPIDAIEAWSLGFSLGNAVKYIARHNHKGTALQDLRKARWYLEREIERLEKHAATHAANIPEAVEDFDDDPA